MSVSGAVAAGQGLQSAVSSLQSDPKGLQSAASSLSYRGADGVPVGDADHY
jgi:hypothetical protein